MQLVILGLVALTLVQTLHTNTTARRMLNVVESLEGIPWNEVAAWGADPSVAVASGGQAEPISLTMVSISRRSVPEALLLVDGRPVGSFASGSITVAVVPGQVVSVDAARASDPQTFRVVGPPGLTSPALGTSVTTRGNVATVGVVQTVRR